MRQKKKLLPLVLSAFVMMAVSFGVNAAEEQTESETVVEYENYEDILEEVQTEDGAVLYFSSCEKIDGVYQVLYQDAQTLQETIEARASSNSPRIVVSVQKEVVMYYDSFNEIKDSIYYEEYNDTYQTWMKGTLSIVSTEKFGSRFKAVYSGSIYGTI